MSLQDSFKEYEPFSFVLNQKGNRLGHNRTEIPYEPMKKAVERFNETRALTHGEIKPPDLSTYASNDLKQMRCMEINTDFIACSLSDVIMTGDEDDWQVTATVKPLGLYGEVVERLHKEGKLAFSLRAGTKLSVVDEKVCLSEILIVTWDLIDPSRKQ